jgi:hypothetical protein
VLGPPHLAVVYSQLLVELDSRHRDSREFRHTARLGVGLSICRHSCEIVLSLAAADVRVG